MGTRSAHRMPGLAVAVTFLLALAFFAEVLGHLARPLNTLLGMMFLVLFLGQHVSQDMLGSFRRRWPAWLLTVAAPVGVFCSTGWVRILFVSLLVGGVALLQSAEARDRAGLRVFQTTAFAYGLFLWFWRETTAGWYALDGATGGLIPGRRQARVENSVRALAPSRSRHEL